jgi:uncharacterized RDD family membrane protein YckC
MDVPFAKGPDRIVAYAIDAVACGMFLLFLVLIFEGYSDSKAAGSALFACITFSYQLFFLMYREGITVGKYARNIQPISSNGMPLRTGQMVARAALTSMPYFLIGAERSLPHGEEILSTAAQGFASALGVALLFADLYVLEFHKQPRTLTDRLAGTIVINLPPPQPHRAPAFPMYSRDDAEFGVKPNRDDSKSRCHSPTGEAHATATSGPPAGE